MPRNRSRSHKNTDSTKNNINTNLQPEDVESPRNKPPIDSKPSSKSSSRINLKNEDNPELKRRTRSRSASKDRKVKGNGKLNKKFDFFNLNTIN